jgi:phosphomannomutase
MDLPELRSLRQRAERWIEGDPDPRTQGELRALLAKSDAELAKTDLEDRFASSLEFGTAGLRGVLGAGPNRMNRAVVARATWGLARHLLATVAGAAERGVVVGCDARHLSTELSEDTAAILAASGIKVVLFRHPVPTPLVGFAVKKLGAAAGVVVTASHNPPEYNGYKVYWQNAAQIIPPVDAGIAAEIARAPAGKDVERPSLQSLMARGLVTEASADLEKGYLDAVLALQVHPRQGDRALGIVYTPMHGVGDDLLRRAMSAAGFPNVTSVPEQQKPDGAFPTVAFPNPEEKGAMDLSLALARKTGAQLVIANDPDADRLAVAVPDSETGRDGYRQLTGNQVGALLGHYLLTEQAAGGARRAVLASLVSSPLLGRIAASLGVRYEETLTGFKWIANRAMDLEHEGYQFVFGFEEALGYCVGDVVRDKDGISAALLFAEMAAVLRARGSGVLQSLDSIARQWGVFTSSQVNVVRRGASGVVALREMMDRLRANPPRTVGDDAVVAVSDYEARTRTVLATGKSTPLTLPASNVLAFELASGSRIIARPSGTEPKAKFYFDVRQEVRHGEAVAEATARAVSEMRKLEAAFGAIAT